MSLCYIQGVPKKWLKKAQSKLSAVGPNFPINVTWERLILLGPSRNDQKDIFQAQGVPATGVWTCGALWLQHYPVSNFYIAKCTTDPRVEYFCQTDWQNNYKKLKYIPHESNMSPNCKQNVQSSISRKALTTFGMKKCDPLKFPKWDVI